MSSYSHPYDTYTKPNSQVWSQIQHKRFDFIDILIVFAVFLTGVVFSLILATQYKIK